MSKLPPICASRRWFGLALRYCLGVPEGMPELNPEVVHWQAIRGSRRQQSAEVWADKVTVLALATIR